MSFQGFPNKATQTGWFKTTDTYSHSSGGEKSEIRASAGPCPLSAATGGCSLPLPAPGGPRCSTVCGRVTPVSACLHMAFSLCFCVSVKFFCFCKYSSHIGVEVHQILYDLSLTNDMCNSLISKESHTLRYLG